MELNKIGNFKIIKVVQTSHHQTDARYDVSRGIQCSCTSLMPIIWTSFKLPHFWELIDLDSISQKGDKIFKSINKFSYLGVEDVPQVFDRKWVFGRKSLIHVDFPENRTRKRTEIAYLVSITEVISSSQQIGCRAHVIVNKSVSELF